MKKIIIITILLLSTNWLYSQDNGWWNWWNTKSTGSFLVANPDTVLWSPYTPVVTIATDSINVKSTDGSTFTDFINVGNQTRIRQGYGLENDEILLMKIFVGDYTANTFSQIRIWRRNQLTGTYTLVGSAMINPTENGSQFFTVSIPNVREGDFVGLRIKTTDSVYNIRSGNSKMAVLTKDNADSVDVTFTTSIANSYIPIYVYGKAPIAVFLGNSLTGGSSHHYPYCYPDTIFVKDYIDWTMPNYTCYRYGMSYQNMGYGGQVGNDMRLRIKTDVVDLKPRICFLENTNDIEGEVANIVNIWKAMVDTCVSHNIIPILSCVPPKGSSNASMMRRDTMTTQISAYVLSKGGLLFDPNPLLGIQRDTGTPPPPIPNFYDPKLNWTYDGVHYKNFGYKEWGRGLDSLLNKNYKLTDTTAIIHVHNPTFGVNVLSGVNITDTVWCYHGRPDSTVIIATNMTTSNVWRTAMTFIDSLSLEYSYRYLQPLVFPPTGDSISYVITSYYGSKMGSSATKKFRADTTVYPPKYTTNFVHEWIADESMTIAWKSSVDTLTWRQGTAGNQPTLLTNEINGRSAMWFNSKFMTCTAFNLDTFTIVLVIKKVDYVSNIANYFMFGTGGFADTSTTFGSSMFEFDGTKLRGATGGMGATWHIVIMQNAHIYIDGVETSYSGGTSTLTNVFNISELGGRTGLSLYSNIEIAYIAVYHENTATPLATINTYLNALYNVY